MVPNEPALERTGGRSRGKCVSRGDLRTPPELTEAGGSENRNAMGHTSESYSYEPAPEWNGKGWLAVVVITRGRRGSQGQKRFTSELRFESQQEAYAESMALGQRIIYQIISAK
jgi:hypothetical protein